MNSTRAVQGLCDVRVRGVRGARGVWCAAGVHVQRCMRRIRCFMRRTECFMYFSAHVLTHFSSVAVSALLRKETTHSLKHRSTSPLNMRSVSFSCISSSFCSIAAKRQGQQRSRLRVDCCRRRGGRTLLLSF